MLDNMLGNNEAPLVSVVIPFYSNVKWLCEAVDSVIAQETKDYEIIVVNDGSKEDVSLFLSKYRDRVKYFYKENGGPATARNFGIKEAKGQYIAFLDSDDLWNVKKLAVQIELMKKYGADWSYTDYEIFGLNIKTSRKKMQLKKEGLYSYVSPYIGTPTIIIRRSILIENSFLFCEDLRYGEDSVLWEQIINKVPILYIEQNLASVRIRGDNAGRRAAVQIIAKVKNYDKCVKLIPRYKKKKTLLYKLAILLCRFGCLFVREKKEKNRFVELIAKCLYVLPYIIFKIDFKINKIKN